MATPEELLLGEREPGAPGEKAAMMRRHKAAMTLVKKLPTPEERLELLKAVVWPSEDFRDALREGDETDST